jgi:hypothetical protein
MRRLPQDEENVNATAAGQRFWFCMLISFVLYMYLDIKILHAKVYVKRL